jgi:hypothetical protein
MPAWPLRRGCEGDGRAGDRVAVLVGDGDGEWNREALADSGRLAVGGTGRDAGWRCGEVFEGVAAGLCAGGGGGCGEGAGDLAGDERWCGGEAVGVGERGCLAWAAEEGGAGAVVGGRNCEGDGRAFDRRPLPSNRRACSDDR